VAATHRRRRRHTTAEADGARGTGVEPSLGLNLLTLNDWVFWPTFSHDVFGTGDARCLAEAIRPRCRGCRWAGSSRAGCHPPGPAILGRSVASASNTRGESRVRQQRMLGSVRGRRVKPVSLPGQFEWREKRPCVCHNTLKYLATGHLSNPKCS